MVALSLQVWLAYHPHVWHDDGSKTRRRAGPNFGFVVHETQSFPTSPGELELGLPASETHFLECLLLLARQQPPTFSALSSGEQVNAWRSDVCP